MQILKAGGILMYFILLMGIVGLYAILERFSYFALKERNMWLLSLAANASPLLGLLGTVTGMITAFNSIALNGTGDAGILAKGISEALYTTAGGLFVAIPCMIFYNYFNKRIDLVVADIEKTCTELLNYFRE